MTLERALGAVVAYAVEASLFLVELNPRELDFALDGVFRYLPWSRSCIVRNYESSFMTGKAFVTEI